MKISRSLQLLGCLLIAVIVAYLFYWNSLSLQATNLANGARYEPAECWFKKPVSIKTECGYMTTRKEGTESASFKLPVVVLRHSQWKNSESPMLHISGGPGGPAFIDAESMVYWVENFRAQNWGVDFVLYDQRGTGLSQPFLDCPDSREARLESFKKPLTASEDSLEFTEHMQRCYEQLAKSADTVSHLSAISTKHSSEDIADLHDLLGAKQWVLMGVSYGTRLALDFVKRFPEKVHSLVLDSVYPPEFDGFEVMIENGFKGIDKILENCASDATCEALFPHLPKKLHQALSLLAESPLLLVSKGDSTLTSQAVLLTAHRLILLLDYVSYDSRLFREVPAAISAVLDRNSNHQSLLKLANNYLEIELFDQFSEAVYMITECKENGRFDMPSLYKRIQPYREKYPMLDWSPQGIYSPEVCRSWLKDPSSSSQPYRESVTTDKPTLILGGGLDSITPPEWGEYLSTILSNSRYVEYPNIGHSVLTSSLCANDEVQKFLRPQINKTAFCNNAERSYDRSGKLNWVPN